MNRQSKLKPVFNFARNKSNILIHRCKAEICADNHTYSGDGEVQLELLPRAKIVLYGHFRDIPIRIALPAISGSASISSFSINGRQIEGFLLNGGGNVDTQEFRFKWGPKSEPINGVGDESTQITKIIFHLFNFVEYLGGRSSAEKCGTTTYTIHHADLICDEWKIELKSLPSTFDRIKMLQNKGGYQLTHVGSIERTDGSIFSGKEAKECLGAIRFFLSLAKGGWCTPICAVGFDVCGNRTWESWSSPSVPWRQTLTWFDPHNSAQLTTLFPLFMARWKDTDWREALRETIYWYQNANESSRGIDAGIILTQAAIERLSYEYCVKYKRLLTAEGFKVLRASDEFRLLFSSLGIPLEIPQQSPGIQDLSRQFKWIDAPQALTEIRNSLIHPTHKKRGELQSVYHEAWNLGLWYLEMSVLGVCGYSGTYGNRLKQRWIGQVDNVPWSRMKTT